MIIVWGRVVAKEGQLQELERLSLEHVQRSRGEPGCIRHSVQRDIEHSNVLVFYEEWQGMAALQDHFNVPESGQFLVALRELSLGEPEIKMYEAQAAI